MSDNDNKGLVDVSKMDAKQVEKDFAVSRPSGEGGIKSFRKQTAKKPGYHCSNCKCDRYSPCTCTKGKANG